MRDFRLAGQWIIRIWAGPSAVPTQQLMVLICLWVLIATFMNNTATILVAKGDTPLMAWTGLASSLFNLALSIYWVQRIGAPGFVLGTIVSFLVILVAPRHGKAIKS